jgi:hypothetical protein
VKNFIFIAVLFFSYSSFAVNYVVGEGSEFKMYSEKTEPVYLSIYITESSFTKLGVEYYFAAGGIFGAEVWQQFGLGIQNKTLTLDEGYILSNNMKKAEIMTPEFLKNNKGGVQIEDFFFSKMGEIEKFKIGIEKIEVPAGLITCTHYQKVRDDQTVDFWISDKAGALGLVKLVSQGKKDKNHNYKIELQALIKNVKAKINKKEAVPLSEKGRLFLDPKL